MPLLERSDYVYAPTVDIVMDKACLVGTKTHAYVVMDKVAVDRGFLTEVLSSDTLEESITMEGESVRNHVRHLLSHADTTLDTVSGFFEGLKERWKDGVHIYDLGKAKRIKANKGLWVMPGSMLVKFEGDMGYTIVATGIPKPHKVHFAEFYAGR